MSPTQRKAMEDARNALQRAAYTTDRPDILGLCEQADDSLRAALAEADEPVAWRYWWDGVTNPTISEIKPRLVEQTAKALLFRKLVLAEPLYAHPPRREPLTDEQVDALAIDTEGLPASHIELARAVELAHGIGTDE